MTRSIVNVGMVLTLSMGCAAAQSNTFPSLTVNGTAGGNPNTGSEVPYSNTLTFQPSSLYTIGAIKMVDPTNSYVDNGDMTFSAGAGR